jgi:hypothetical protein
MKNNPIVRRIFKILCKYRMQDESLGNFLARTMTGKYYPELLVVFKRFDTDTDALFVSAGCMACYGFDQYGDPYLLGLYGENSIISTRSFHAQEPSDFEWVALPGTYLYKVSTDAMTVIYKDFSTTQELARIILAEATERELLRLIGLRRKAFEVVRDFYTEYPEWLQQGEPLLFEDIAGYLLMAPDTFRKARMKLIKSEGLNNPS